MRTKNLQIKVTDEFYHEFQKVADVHQMTVSALGGFALRQWLDTYEETIYQNKQLQGLINSGLIEKK